MDEAKYIERIKNSKNEEEFRSNLFNWWSKTEHDYLWRIREYMHMNDDQEKCLTECLTDVHGHSMSHDYDTVIRFVYALKDDDDIFCSLEKLFRINPPQTRIENMRSMCEYYKIDMTANQKKAIDFYENILNTVADEFYRAELWRVAASLREEIRKKNFMMSLSGLEWPEVATPLREVLDFVEKAELLNTQQEKWVKEYMAKPGHALQDTTASAVDKQTDTSLDNTAQEPDSGKGKFDELYNAFIKDLTKDQKKQVEKYFPIALEHGYMEKTEDGYRWKQGFGQKAQLAWFLRRIISPRGFEKIPYSRMNKLFNESRLDRAIGNDVHVKYVRNWENTLCDDIFGVHRSELKSVGIEFVDVRDEK